MRLGGSSAQDLLAIQDLTQMCADLELQVRRLTRQLDEALAALKSTDSWLWNKVVNGCYGEPENTGG